MFSDRSRSALSATALSLSCMLSAPLILSIPLRLLAQPQEAPAPQGSAEKSADTRTPLSTTPGEIEALLDASDDINRGRSSHGRVKMSVKTSRYEREMEMELWTEGEERSLIRVLSPKRERGVATLKVGDEAWNYLPKVARTLKLSTASMGGAWMGSHLTNDDLVRGSRMRDDYTWALYERPQGEGEAQTGRYEVHLTPKPEAPVVWGLVKLWVSAQRVPERIEYFNERGALLRTISFHEVTKKGERLIPMLTRVTPADKPNERTELRYLELEFDVKLPPRTFSLQALKRATR
jgi:hypothetical protein